MLKKEEKQACEECFQPQQAAGELPFYFRRGIVPRRHDVP